MTSSEGKPVAGSSVFINSTSRGTTTDKDGYFELNNIPAGKYDLIISNIGFETVVYSFSSEQLPLQLKVELQLKVKELDNLIVEASVEEGWDKWGTTFTQNFIGSTPNAAHCTIENKKKIKFRYYKNSHRLVAYADEPIILYNTALGYKISFQLEELEVNFQQKTSTFYGYPLFEELEAKRKNQQERWDRNRNKAFYGSMMHFMRCLYSNTIAEEGFEVRRVKRLPNEEKKRVVLLYKETIKAHQNDPVTYSIDPFNVFKGLPADTIEYYRKVIAQSDYIDLYGSSLLGPDSLITRKEESYKTIFFPDYLSVIYKNAKPEPEYISLYRLEDPSVCYSMITLLTAEEITIDINGSYFPPQNVFSSGYWGWNEKLCNFLPLDYKPVATH